MLVLFLPILGAEQRQPVSGCRDLYDTAFGRSTESGLRAMDASAAKLQIDREGSTKSRPTKPASLLALLTFADDRSSLPLRPLGCQDGRVALILSPLLDPREHGGIPQHVRHDAKDDLVSADVQLLQSARLAPYVGLDAVLFVRQRRQPRQNSAPDRGLIRSSVAVWRYRM